MRDCMLCQSPCACMPLWLRGRRASLRNREPVSSGHALYQREAHLACHRAVTIHAMPRAWRCVACRRAQVRGPAQARAAGESSARREAAGRTAAQALALQRQLLRQARGERDGDAAAPGSAAAAARGGAAGAGRRGPAAKGAAARVRRSS